MTTSSLAFVMQRLGSAPTERMNGTRRVIGRNNCVLHGMLPMIGRRGFAWLGTTALICLSMKLGYLALVAAVLITAVAFAHDSELAPGSPALIQPEDLAKTMQSAGAGKPVILYVGPHTFYAQAHIPGAEYIGPAVKAEGMDKLRSRAKSLPHEGLVVIYCGCCPWDHCPNIHPAYHELTKMGVANLKVLYLATSFGANWAEKGYPVATGD